MPDKQPTHEQIKANVLTRLKKIEGQIRGIQSMVEAGKECEDILIQVRAVRSALKSTSALILKRYLLRCHEQAAASGSPDEARRQLEKTVKVLSDFLDG